MTNTRKQQAAALASARSRLQNAAADYQRQERADRERLGLLTAKAKLANAKAEYRRRDRCKLVVSEYSIESYLPPSNLN